MRQRKTPRLGDLCEHVVRLGSVRTRNVGTNYEGFCEWCEPKDSGVGVRVLVSKERLEQKWPTEKDGPEGAAFRKFAARLADAVQIATSQGVKIRPAFYCSFAAQILCPLGCLPESRKRRRSSPINGIEGLSNKEVCEFVCSFDLGEIGPPVDSPYYRLGLEYLKRFVTKGKQENV